MLKKVMAILASKVSAIKVRVRAVKTHLMIQSLLLGDRKMVRHLFQRRKCFKHEPDVTTDSEAVMWNSVSTTPASVVQVAEEIDDTMEVEDDDAAYPDSEPSSPFEENPVSVVEMVRNAKEGRGKEFKLEDDIDKVADLFIQRFHHQIWLQKQHSDEGIHA